MERDSIFKPMPRQASLVDADPGPTELQVSRLEYPKASIWLLIWRSLQWQISIFRYMFARFRDSIRGEKSDARKGRRLRELFERVGGTGIKIGQQLAMRVDFFPYAVCRELDKLLDSVEPFPVEQALERIEKSLGQPASEIFAEFDPEPIGAASVACVWAATLRSGERVAVKVQRPGIEKYFAADIELASRFTRFMEALSVIRPGFLQNLRDEMKEMFFTELNFVQEANYQIMFRKMTKRAKLKWLTAPKVFVKYSSADILVTEFVHGHLGTEMLQAIEDGNEDKLALYEQQNIDYNLIGKRIVMLSLWSRLENFFFHSDPHPGNLFILPDSKIVLIDFGACGVNYSGIAGAEFETSRRLLMDDIAGSSAASLLMQAPLPSIDIERFLRVVTRIAFKRYIDLKSKEAEWWERTTAALWLSIIDATREFNIPANINMLRLIRSSLLYDTLAFRFNPDIDFIKSFRKWVKKAAKRGNRDARRQRLKDDKIALARSVKNYGDTRETLERGVFFSREVLRTAPRQFIATAGQSAYVFSMLIKLGLSYMLLFTLGIAGLFVYFSLFSDVSVDMDVMLESVQDMASNPVFIVIAFLLFFQNIGHIQKKLRETK